MATKTDHMREIRDKVLNLTASPLYEYRKKNGYYPVIGEGSHDATVMFIGEAPGKNEAEQGRPFCGAAGRILDQLLESIGVKREDVYITNIVKDRPPENRDPLPEEIKIYSPFLDEQINIIQPQVIATLGRFSMKYILEKFHSPEASRTISQLHGKVIPTQAQYGTINIVPLYHPAVSIYSQSSKQTLFDDFKVLQQFFKS